MTSFYSVVGQGREREFCIKTSAKYPNDITPSCSSDNNSEFTLFSRNLEVIAASLINIVWLKMETKFTHMLKGIAAVLFIKMFAEVTNFNALISLIEKVTNCGPMIGAVIFQPEIRDALQYLGRKIHFKKRRSVNARLLLSLEEALYYMSKRKIGALISLERLMSLEDFIASGTRLDAVVTGELIMNIFTPNTPLHDGAVIIRRATIAAASAYLPLTARTLSSKFGTRHRAALGISEVSDSITLVVSEESGAISVSYNSSLINNLTVDKCLQIVKREMSWM